MDQKIGIKIEGPVEEKMPLPFSLMLTIVIISLMGTVAFLLVEFLNVPIPKFWH